MSDDALEQGGTVAEPANLEDAIKALRAKDAPVAPEDVEAPESDDQGTEHDEHWSEPGEQHNGSASPDGVGGESQASYESLATGEAGGSADTIGAAGTEYQGSYTNEDYNQIQQRIVASVRQQAAMAANERFRQEGIEKATLTQLYQRDEDTGRVTFHNPDDPDRPFESRAQAQAWVDSYNQQVEAEWVNYANQMQQQFASQTLPAMRLIQFAPIYDSMDQRTQRYFDAVIEDYAVKDSTGAVIGYSCDLNAAHAQAQRLAAIEGGANVKEVQDAGGQTMAKTIANAPSSPALDATTSGSDTSAEKKESPKNLEDAFKILNKNKRKGAK